VADSRPGPGCPVWMPGSIATTCAVNKARPQSTMVRIIMRHI